jgi:hypothetical protein
MNMEDEQTDKNNPVQRTRDTIKDLYDGKIRGRLLEDLGYAVGRAKQDSAVGRVKQGY